jgi:hypothetical protein
MGNLLIGKNSAIIGFTMFFLGVLSLVVGLLAAQFCFDKQEVFFGILSIATTLVWIIIVLMLFKMVLNGVRIKDYLLPIIGFNYVINHSTRQIHRLKNKKSDCLIEQMINKKYGNKLYVSYLLKYKKYDGCKHCYKEKDKSNS